MTTDYDEVAKSKGQEKPSNAGIFISYRVPPASYQEFERIAKIAYEGGGISKPTVTALAKSSLFTQANLFKS